MSACIYHSHCGIHRPCLQPQHPNWTAVKPAPPPAAQLTPLVEAADALGRLVQYSHQARVWKMNLSCLLLIIGRLLRRRTRWGGLVQHRHQECTA